MTRTYAKLEVSREAYAEVAGALQAAGYGHVFRTEGNVREIIDMDGLALVAAKAVIVEPRRVHTFPLVTCMNRPTGAVMSALYLDGEIFKESGTKDLATTSWILINSLVDTPRLVQRTVSWDWRQSLPAGFPCFLKDIHPDAWIDKKAP